MNHTIGRVTDHGAIEEIIVKGVDLDNEALDIPPAEEANTGYDEEDCLDKEQL